MTLPKAERIVIDEELNNCNNQFGNLSTVSDDNQGTLILDATCASANIRYPQDFSLLNEAREKLETICLKNFIITE